MARKRRTRPWKQAIRLLRPEMVTKAIERGPTVQVGVAKRIEREAIDRGLYQHLQLTVGDDGQVRYPDDPVLPPASMGPASTRNIDGWEEIHHDGPMEPYSNVVDTPNWGDWSKGSHPTDLGGMRRQRTFHVGRMARIQLERLGVELDGRENVRFTVTEPIDTTSDELEDQLFELGNLLQENVGAFDVHSAAASREEYLRTLHLDWQILPPGESDRAVDLIIEGRGSTSERGRIQERIDVLLSLDPVDLVVGTDGFNRYFGARLSDELVVFENAEYGNAIYVMGLDWETSSRTARTALLDSQADFTRVVHSKNWKNRLRGEVAIRISAN